MEEGCNNTLHSFTASEPGLAQTNTHGGAVTVSFNLPVALLLVDFKPWLSIEDCLSRWGTILMRVLTKLFCPTFATKPRNVLLRKSCDYLRLSCLSELTDFPANQSSKQPRSVARDRGRNMILQKPEQVHDRVGASSRVVCNQLGKATAQGCQGANIQHLCSRPQRPPE